MSLSALSWSFYFEILTIAESLGGTFYVLSRGVCVCCVNFEAIANDVVLFWFMTFNYRLLVCLKICFMVLSQIITQSSEPKCVK
jgi:hypothetical protein